MIAPEHAAALIARHLELFNEPDRAKREQAMAAVYTADLLFTDPHHQSVGYQGYGDAADGLHARFRGLTLRKEGAIDIQYDLARFGWRLTSPEGPEIHGIDVIRFRDGLIAEVAIFIDPPPV
ncbi:MAG: nuclear transport factor 2 family protein [Alphaproteobacteria bacterium]|nr:nuclear transport factor 2 family protein [Alphaproteobacteria bacterium]